MKPRSWFFVLLLAAPLWFAGCKPDEPTGPAAKQYPIKGKVVAVDVTKHTVKLNHEDIPGLMRGMTMSLDVADARLLDGLKEGDEVQGTLKVESGKYILTELKKR